MNRVAYKEQVQQLHNRIADWEDKPDVQAEKELLVMVSSLRQHDIPLNGQSLQDYVSNNREVLIQYEYYTDTDIENIIDQTR